MLWRIVTVCLTLWLGGVCPAIAAEQKERMDPVRDYGDVYFWTADSGLIGDGQELVLTRDAGRTWTPVLSVYGPDRGLASIRRFGTLSSQLWWFEDSGNLWRTMDQGQTWTIRPLPNVGQVVFVAPDEAWAVQADSKALAHSLDGGLTWQRKTLTGAGNRRLDIVRLSFVSPSVGWVEGGDNSLLQTTDGGQTWVSHGQLPGHFPLLFFLDRYVGYALDLETPKISFTRDGGAIWQTAILPGLPSRLPLGSVFALDPLMAWAVGSRGTILGTTDGGATWQIQRSGTSQALAGIFFTNRLHGWAVGHSNTILKTTDGGQTWIKVDDDLKNWQP